MSSMTVPSQYNFILERAKSMPRPLRVAIAGSDTENILRGAIAAHEDGFVDPILIGNYKKTKKILADLGYSDENFDFQPITNDTNPVQYAIEMILSGNADCLMRGNTQTRDLLLPVLNKTNHLIEEDRLLTHAVIFTVPGEDRLMAISDVTLLINPSLEKKEEVIRNLVEELGVFGVKRPKIALLAMVEKPSFHIKNSVEAQTIVMHHNEDPIADCELVGPITYDLIMSKEAARLKHYDCPYCGEFDGIVVPHLLAGNSIVKVLETHTDTVSCGVLVGAKIPIAITGRSEKPIASYLSLAACCSQWLRMNKKNKK